MVTPKTALVREDILDTEDFLAQRTDLQQQLRAHKADRRLDIGPFTSVYFESYFTMWWQVHEMLRVEQGGEEQIAEELAAYATLVPNGRSLCATMMIEIDEPVRRARELARLGGIEHTIELVIGGDAVRGESDDDLDRTNADGKASAVHFFVFNLTDDQAAALKDKATEVQFRCTHDNYNHTTGLSAATKVSLAADLS